MKIYLAARYERAEELRKHGLRLLGRGHDITSRWLRGDHAISGDVPSGDDGATTEEAIARRIEFGQQDFEDVRSADLLIAFTEADGSPWSRGGRHVELGLALAWGKSVWIVGPRENIFCWLPQVTRFESFEGVLRALGAIQ